MTPHHFIVATAGHVDHGKSALVKALTGTDPDRLPEEKARGITIDLGFAHLELAAPNLVGARTGLSHPVRNERGENSPKPIARLEPLNHPLTRPSGTLSPTGGEGWVEGAVHGEGREEGQPTADTPEHLQGKRPSSAQPSPPSAGGEGEDTGALDTYPAPAAGEGSSTPDPRPSTFSLGIVDVPGHEDFVKNMVAGVGSIDLALLVVAADDGWMPQTEEHLQILDYLGVKRAVVALSKIDLAEGRESEAVAALREQLRGTPFAGAPIVPTSVLASRGLDELKAVLAEALDQIPPPRDVGKPRLPVDRVFTLRGIGTVVTGTLMGGRFQRGQAVVIQPAGQTTRIRSLQNHSRDVESIGPGSRAAINLPDIAKGSEGSGEAGVWRGEVITLADLGRPCDTWDVLLEKSGRLKGGKSPAARPLKDGTLVRVHLGSGNSPARVILQESGRLEPGQVVMAQLRFDRAVLAFLGDHFILRDSAEQFTLAGGVVLDPDASRKGFRSPGRSQFLRDCGTGESVGAVASAHLSRDGAVRRAALLLKSRFSAQEISGALADLVQKRQAILAGEWAAAKPWWDKMCRCAVEAIDAGHLAHPDRAGLALSELRARLGKELPSPELFDALLAELCASGFIQAGVFIRRATHRPALPPHLQAAGARLRAALAARPAEPPSRKELAPDAVAQQALRFLLQTGEAIELGEDVILLTESFVRMKEAIVGRIREKGPATVSDLRQLLGTTRRIMMPLLDRLDREAVTVRKGDLRTLRGDRAR